VLLLIDGDVLKSEYFGCHPCENTSGLKILTSDLVKKILPALGYTYTVVEL
jgi:Ala-tRNA(Pro) deacylase